LKKIIVLLVLFTSIFIEQGFTQAIVKSIYIIDSKTKIPIADATANAEKINFNKISDENGLVNASSIKDTTTLLSISRIGYETKIVSIVNLLLDNNLSIIYLDPKVSSLSEVVVKASAKSGIFKTISDLDIHLRPINNSQEVLRIVPGLFIGQHAGGGKSEQIFLRGFDIDHGTDINITVDGMPVNMVSHAHGQGYADLHFVIPELIDKVNFNKGPYFADKGNLTTAGFVEFKTKNYLDNNFAKTEVGQFNTFRNIIGLNLLKQNKAKRNQSLYIAGESSFTKGYFDSPQNFSRYNGMLKYHGSINKQSTITATATAFTSKWNASGQIPERALKDAGIGFFGAIDNTEGGNTARHNLILDLTTNLKNGAVLKNQVFCTKNKFELYSNFTFYKNDSINGDQIRQKENRDLLGYIGSYQKDHTIGRLNTQTLAGVQVRYDAINDLELSRTKDRTVTTEPIMIGAVKEVNAAAYVAQKLNISKKLEITAGLRTDFFKNKYDDALLAQSYTSQSTIVSPKLNFNYKLNDKVQLYWYNGRGFHSNDTRVAVKQNGKKVVPPGFGSDIGGVFKLGKKLVLQSAIWYLQLDQEFVYVGDEGVVEASGKSRRFGLDASLRYEVAKNLFADIDLSLANPRATEVPRAESYLPLAPRFTSVGGLTYRKEYGWNGSLRYRFMGDRPANEDYSVTAKGYFIVDAAINYSKKKWEAGISIQNVLNTKWKETQFDTESKLRNEAEPISEIHFTPGSPFFARASFTIFF
jgi:TonB-dependent Receptor Plug Domain